MWECDYAREPVNYRLFFLKLIKKIWILPTAALLGALVIGGIYYVVKLVIGDGYQYQARTVYYVQYAKDDSGAEADYYNYYTWQELLKTDYFVDGMYDAMGGAVSKEYLMSNVTATVESDYRYLYTKSVSGDIEKSIDMEHKLSNLMVAYSGMRSEIDSIEVIDAADESSIEDVSLIFVSHAAIVGAVIGFIAAVLFFIFFECVDTSVYLPSTLEKRYHIAALGCASMKEFEANCEHILAEKKTAVIMVDSSEGSVGKNTSPISPEYDVTVCANPIDKSDEMSVIREKNNVVLAVKAGAHNGKKIERLIEQLARQEIGINAFLLIDEDKWLINRYYK